MVMICDDKACYLVDDAADAADAAATTATATTADADVKEESTNKTDIVLPKEDDKWTVYGKKPCPYCVMAKDLLDSKKEPYVYYDIDLNIAKTELADLTGGYKMVPMIFKNGKFIGGYTDLTKHF